MAHDDVCVLSQSYILIPHHDHRHHHEIRLLAQESVSCNKLKCYKKVNQT